MYKCYRRSDSAPYFLYMQIITSLAYLVYLIDGYQQSWLRILWGFESQLSFYYLCGKRKFKLCSSKCLRYYFPWIWFFLLWPRVQNFLLPQIKFTSFVVNYWISCLYFQMQELYCFLPCLAFLGASLLVMIEEFAMIWLNRVENYVFVAVNLGNNTDFICSQAFDT